MTKSKRKRMMKYRQKKLNQMFAYLIITNLLIVLMIVSFVARTSENNKSEDECYLTVYESIDNHNAVTSSANVLRNIFE